MGSHPGSEVTLFNLKFSPYAQRVRIALGEKGIPYDLVNIDPFNKPKELTDANPIYGTVPTLIHNGNPVLESTIILEYLEDAFPDKSNLMPKDPIARSKVRFYTDYIYKNFPNLKKIATTQPGTPEREATLEHMPGFLKSLDSIMTEFSAEGPYFTGDKFSYLDVVLAPLTAWRLFIVEKLQFPLPDPATLPRFGKWVKTVKAHESVKDVVPSPQEAAEYLHYRLTEHAKSLQAKGK